MSDDPSSSLNVVKVLACGIGSQNADVSQLACTVLQVLTIHNLDKGELLCILLPECVRALINDEAGSQE